MHVLLAESGDELQIVQHQVNTLPNKIIHSPYTKTGYVFGNNSGKPKVSFDKNRKKNIIFRILQSVDRMEI
jgi:hypothetical protein